MTRTTKTIMRGTARAARFATGVCGTGGACACTGTASIANEMGGWVRQNGRQARTDGQPGASASPLHAMLDYSFFRGQVVVERGGGGGIRFDPISPRDAKKRKRDREWLMANEGLLRTTTLRVSAGEAGARSSSRRQLDMPEPAAPCGAFCSRRRRGCQFVGGELTLNMQARPPAACHATLPLSRSSSRRVPVHGARELRGR